jgi:ribulose-phosphate 3-epimerase
MIEIIPAVLPRTLDELRAAAERFAASGVRRASLDVSDGIFVPNETLSGYEELSTDDWGLEWDVHLMVQQPEDVIDRWLDMDSVERLIVHVEATDKIAELSGRVRARSKQFGVAINPDTPLDKLDAVAEHVDLVQFMTIIPGEQGRPFDREVLARIKQSHEAYPDLPIAVDGGVTPQTAPLCVQAGATILISGSYVLKSEDIGQAIETLRQSVL